MDEAKIFTPNGSLSFSDLRNDCFGLRSVVKRKSQVVLKTNSAMEVLATLFALNGWADSVAIAPLDYEVEIPIAPLVYLSDFAKLERKNPMSIHTFEDKVETNWILYSSGTTGKPKPVIHSFGNLTRRVKKRSTDSIANWGLTYDPTKMAGIQVMVQALVADSNLIAPSADSSLEQKIAFLISNKCNHLSATPTFWRRVLQSSQVEHLKLKQITIGGEICDQKLLDSLLLQFKGARISQIYASTELGAIFSVTDGKAGFPQRYLQDEINGFKFKIKDGLLYVGLPSKTNAGRDWINTQDFVSLVGDRVYFLGRESNWANIGGVKVWLTQVEDVIRKHPNIEDVLVSSIRSEFTGSLLSAKVVTNSTETEFPAILRAWLGEHLPRPHVPAIIKIVKSLQMSPNGKVERK
jgi:acyl-CoA synthetase (AMP-forming)/AMP-acid ligase II